MDKLPSHLRIANSDLEFQSEIGRGSYGVVWKAVWKGAGGDIVVAVKKFNNVSLAVMNDLCSEVLLMSQISHVNIIRLFGVSEDSIIMEYIEGGSLYDILQNNPSLDWFIKLNFAKQAAQAVNFLHHRVPSIIHRDIKSLNFLVTKNHHGEFLLKLIDFGISKVKLATGGATKTIDHKASFGSVRWMAPETTAKIPQWTTKADVFSLGMLFYEIASRKIPFDEVSEDHQVIALIKYEKERPDIPPSCPKSFQSVISACWTHEPENRPTTSEVLSMLNDALKTITPTQNISSSSSSSTLKKKEGLKRMFFEINVDELLKMVSPSNVRVLNKPPPFPGKDHERPQIPNEVKIVELKRETSNPLLSKTYDAQIFERVELYFRRFFTPKDLSYEVIVDEVHVILNDCVTERFKQAEQQLHDNLSGLAELKDGDQSELSRFYLGHLLGSENLIVGRNSNPVSAWHGSKSNKIENICWYGMLNLSTTDPGYYGKAIYFTQEPNYGMYYAESIKEKDKGTFNLILNWVLVGKPYAVTKVEMGKLCEKGYTSHYTLVSKKKSTRDICRTQSDFDMVKGLNEYFPFIQDDPKIQGDEMGIFEGSHVLPQYIVKYTVIEKKSHSFKSSESTSLLTQINNTNNNNINNNIEKQQKSKKEQEEKVKKEPVTASGSSSSPSSIKSKVSNVETPLESRSKSNSSKPITSKSGNQSIPPPFTQSTSLPLTPTTSSSIQQTPPIIKPPVFRDYKQLLPDGNQKCKRVYGSELGDGFGKFNNPRHITIIPKHWFEINSNNNNNNQNSPLASSSSSSQPNTPSQKQPFSSDDLLVISDCWNQRIVLIEKTSGKVKSIIGSGKKGSQAGELNYPNGTAITFSSTHPNLILLVVDFYNDRLQSFDIETGKYLNHFTHDKYIKNPWGICVESTTTNQIFVANYETSTITIHTGYPNTNNNNNGRNNNDTQFGTLLRVIGDNDGIKFNRCFDVKINSKGDFIISSLHKIDILDGNNNYTLIKSFGSKGNKNGEFISPYSVCVDALDNILVCDTNYHRVQIFDKNGNWINSFGKEGNDESSFTYPISIIVDNENGDIYVVDQSNHRMMVF